MAAEVNGFGRRVLRTRSGDSVVVLAVLGPHEKAIWGYARIVGQQFPRDGGGDYITAWMINGRRNPNSADLHDLVGVPPNIEAWTPPLWARSLRDTFSEKPEPPAPTDRRKEVLAGLLTKLWCIDLHDSDDGGELKITRSNVRLIGAALRDAGYLPPLSHPIETLGGTR